GCFPLYKRLSQPNHPSPQTLPGSDGEVHFLIALKSPSTICITRCVMLPLSSAKNMIEPPNAENVVSDVASSGNFESAPAILGNSWVPSAMISKGLLKGPPSDSA